MAPRVASKEPTADDIKKALLPLMELNPHLKDHLASKKLPQQYWTGHFTDFVIEKVYTPKLHPQAAK
jgi:hypothetical protein